MAIPSKLAELTQQIKVLHEAQGKMILETFPKGATIHCRLRIGQKYMSAMTVLGIGELGRYPSVRASMPSDRCRSGLYVRDVSLTDITDVDLP